MTRVSLTVNDQPVSAEVEPRMHLADFLRETQLLTGTHIGCEHGVCGACTIQIDGAPARSCITLAVACEGADIRTVEGFDDDPVMARLRDAFTKEHALQCGYCTPGMLVSARDIVRRLPDADETRIRQELEGNLCRCTGYVGIVRAVKSVLDLPPVPEPDAATETAIEPAEEEPVPKHCNCSASGRRMAGLPRYRNGCLLHAGRAVGGSATGWSRCWPYHRSTRPHPRHVQRIGRYRIRRCQSLRNSPRFRPRQHNRVGRRWRSDIYRPARRHECNTDSD